MLSLPNIVNLYFKTNQERQKRNICVESVKGAQQTNMYFSYRTQLSDCVIAPLFQLIFFSLESLNHYPISAYFHISNFQETSESAASRMTSLRPLLSNQSSVLCPGLLQSNIMLYKWFILQMNTRKLRNSHCLLIQLSLWSSFMQVVSQYQKFCWAGDDES